MKLLALKTSDRSRIFLWWAITVPAGFVTTHFYPKMEVMWLWFAIAGIGLAMMYRQTTSKAAKAAPMHRVFVAWLVPIALGIEVSVGIYYIPGATASYIWGHLGSLWMFLLAIGYFLTGRVDKPMGWYGFGAIISLAGALLCLVSPAFTEVQFLVAAATSGWALFSLVLFRSEPARLSAPRQVVATEVVDAHDQDEAR